jgi:hypothetical protein
MNAQTSLQFYLVLHIIGFTIMAGTIVADLVIQQRMKKYLIAEKQKASIMLETAAGFPLLIGVGAFLLVSTGIGMVIIFKGHIFNMLWFRIKIILVILAMLNGSIILKRNAIKLKVLLHENSVRNDEAILSLKGRMAFFHSIEILLLLTIFILSIFKF